MEDTLVCLGTKFPAAGQKRQVDVLKMQGSEETLEEQRTVPPVEKSGVEMGWKCWPLKGLGEEKGSEESTNKEGPPAGENRPFALGKDRICWE